MTKNDDILRIYDKIIEVSENIQTVIVKLDNVIKTQDKTELKVKEVEQRLELVEHTKRDIRTIGKSFLFLCIAASGGAAFTLTILQIIKSLT